MKSIAIMAFLALAASSATAAKPKGAADGKAEFFGRAAETSQAFKAATARSARAPAGGDKKPAGWTDAGIAKTTVMNFDTLVLGQDVADTYGPGIVYDRAVAISADYLSLSGASSDLPSLPNGFTPYDVNNYGTTTFAAMTATNGFIGGVKFAYATNSFYVALIEAAGYHFQYPKAVAFSGEDGQGKVLGSVDLKWTSKGNLTYAFEEAKLVWKGVAKSVAFYSPTVDGIPVELFVIFDDVKAIAPSGELATKIASKLATAEVEVAAKADKLQGLLSDVEGKISIKPVDLVKEGH